MIDFENWWDRTGKCLDPDTQDVSWYDKRKGLAAMAFSAGAAQSMNYVADASAYPQRIEFAGGKIVYMKGQGHLFVKATPAQGDA